MLINYEVALGFGNLNGTEVVVMAGGLCSNHPDILGSLKQWEIDHQVKLERYIYDHNQWNLYKEASDGERHAVDMKINTDHPKFIQEKFIKEWPGITVSIVE